MHNISYFITCVLAIILLTGCSGNKGPGSWLGNYAYSEEPVKANAGYSMVMDWELSVYKAGDKYKARLNVNGQQTSFSLLNDLTGTDTTLFIIYDHPLDETGNTLRKGDTLFSLLKKKGSIKTRWKMLEPILLEATPKECSCFEFMGKNNNTPKLPE